MSNFETEQGLAMQMEHMEVHTDMPKLAVVTDLGANNEGSIYPDERIPNEMLKSAIEDVPKPEYRKRATRRWRCVDGRLPEGGLAKAEDEADPQMSGGYVIADTAVDLMIEELPADARLSQKIAAKTREAIEEDDIEVVVHGDNHVKTDGEGNPLEETNKAGCGANRNLREVLRKNAENADIIVPIGVDLAKAAGLAEFYKNEAGETDDNVIKDRLNGQIATAKKNAELEEFWDGTPEQVVDIIVENGGTYEELIEDHAEVVAVADMAEGALDEEAFMKDHVVTLPDGTVLTLEAFIASIGEYKKLQFEKAERLGKPDVWAADRVLGVILQTIGTVKKLTKNGFLAAVVVPSK